MLNTKTLASKNENSEKFMEGILSRIPISIALLVTIHIISSLSLFCWLVNVIFTEITLKSNQALNFRFYFDTSPFTVTERSTFALFDANEYLICLKCNTYGAYDMNHRHVFIQNGLIRKLLLNMNKYIFKLNLFKINKKSI